MSMWGESNARSEIERCRPRAHLIHLIGVGKRKKKKISHFGISSLQLWQPQTRKDILFSP